MSVTVARKFQQVIENPTVRSIVKCLAVCAVGGIAKARNEKAAGGKSCCG